MRKYNYTKEERAQLADARKNDKKGLAKLVNKIRKQCVAENRFTEVEDAQIEKPKAKTAKEKKQGCNAEGQFVSKKEAAEEEEEFAVEVHGADGTSVIIK